MNDLNTNKGKKLIIGISILFCTIILIIGATTAYFTEGDTKEIGNIVTENINGTLHYDDNNDYMFGNLIPVNEEDVLKFASKDTDICKYQDGMYACNLYEFTITNNSNVAQELMITLKPTFNEFGNLYYILLDKNKDDISLDNVPVSNDHINGTNSIEIANKIVLGAGSSKTYTLVYYVKNLEDIDQTSMDAGKQFYAKVRVDSITTGTYAETLMEAENCYNYELINDTAENRELYGDLFTSVVGTYKLTEFYGIKDGGDVDTSCGVIKNGEYYSVIIPSKLKGEDGTELEVSTLGNNLFNVIEVEFVEGQEDPNYSYNSNYFKINSIEIEEGIKIIEDGDENTFKGAFIYLGIKEFSNENVPKHHENFAINLPDSLEVIGDLAFLGTAMKELKIPSNVTRIGNKAFFANVYLTNFLIEGANDGTSQLKTIGSYAFQSCSLNYKEQDEYLYLPSSIKNIGTFAFDNNPNLNYIYFEGDESGFGSSWNGNATLLPLRN